MHSVQCIVGYGVHSVQCMCTIGYGVHSVQCIVYYRVWLCIVYSVQCTIGYGCA